MPLKDMLILTTPPNGLAQARETGLTIGHMAYRVGRGPHLFRSGVPVPLRAGLMVVDAKGFDGRGEPGVLCQEILRECAARGFGGVICDFEGRTIPLLERVLSQLDEMLARKGLTLHVPEGYGHCTPKARVLIPSALSGGSLTQRLEESILRFGGPERITLAIQRVAEDFFLPSPTGSGRPMSREELTRQLSERAPSVFFSNELCARYYTYMSRENGAHFILFDDAMSIRKKIQVARSLGISRAVAALPEIDDLLPELLGGKIMI